MNYKELKFIDEKIYETEINGLRVFYIPKKGFTKSYAILTSDFGSKDVEFSVDGGETFKKYPEGIADFLEHKMFEMPGGLNVFNRFTEQGASVNAFTNNHQTSYYFSTTNHFMENLSLLLEMVFTPHLTDENVEKEKGIIAEEIKMYDDHPGFRGYIEALKSMYFRHPVREDIAGTVESIYKLTAQDLIECYEAFYHPENMILVLVGDIPMEEAVLLLEKKVHRGEKLHLVKKTYMEPQNVNKTASILSMGLQVPNYIYGVKVLPESPNLMKESLTGTVMMKLVFGSTSVFYEDMLKEGVINDSFSSEFNLANDHGEIFIGGESKEPQKVLDTIERYINKVLMDEAFFEGQQEAVERIKKSMTGSFVNVFNSVDRIGVTTTGMLLHGEDLFSYVDTLREISISDVKSAFQKVFRKDNAVQIIIS